jgi:hypothetical protein
MEENPTGRDRRSSAGQRRKKTKRDRSREETEDQ